MIAIVNKERSYKSDTAAYLSDKYHASEISFIDPILDLAEELHIRDIDDSDSDSDNDEVYEYNLSLDEFVDDVLRSCRNKETLQGTNISHSFLMSELEKEISQTRGNVIVYDCETPEEIKLLRSKGAVIIGINCDDNYDYVIRSDENLYKNLNNIFKQYGFRKRDILSYDMADNISIAGAIAVILFCIFVSFS